MLPRGLHNRAGTVFPAQDHCGAERAVVEVGLPKREVRLPATVQVHFTHAVST
jgi:hypothetical protein